GPRAAVAGVLLDARDRINRVVSRVPADAVAVAERARRLLGDRLRWIGQVPRVVEVGRGDEDVRGTPLVGMRRKGDAQPVALLHLADLPEAKLALREASVFSFSGDARWIAARAREIEDRVEVSGHGVDRNVDERLGLMALLRDRDRDFSGQRLVRKLRD